MELATMIQQWGFPIGLVVMMIGGWIKLANNLSASTGTLTETMQSMGSAWALAHSKEQDENERLALQQSANTGKILELTERLTRAETTNQIMETLHTQEREKWFEKDTEREQRIAELERRVDALTDAGEQKDERISALESENKDLKAQAKRANEYGESRDKQLEEKAAELKALEKRAKDCEDKQEQTPKDGDKKPIQLHEKKPPLEKAG